jgi:hypothetical protein
MLLVPATEITCCSDVAIKRACVGPDGIDQRGRAGSMSRPKRWSPQVAKRTSIGGNCPAGMRYQSTRSNETVHGVELRSTIPAAGVEAGRDDVATWAHPARAMATKATFRQGRFMEAKLVCAARFLLHRARIIAVW